MPFSAAPQPGLLLIAIGAALFAALALAAVVSRSEGEPRAAKRLAGLSLFVSLPFVAVALIPGQAGQLTGIALLSVTAAGAITLLVPTGSKHLAENDTPTTRIDERDIMFSRARLEPGSDRFEAYYAEKPEHREADDRFRAEPGLLKPGSSYYDPFMFAAADASFETIAELHSMVDGPVAREPEPADPGEISDFIRGWTVKLGAVDVGITELRNYHKYTTVGRGEQYGQPVRLDHRYAIALTVEMAKEMIDCAPRGPTVMESAQQYMASGAIAVQVAQFIRNLGYPARAHIDGNYRVVCPLVARDAGLGEIGRMGLLMTPNLGPRVRIGVVTTDLPLVPDDREPEHSVLDFCSICEKCADVCPSQAIARGLRTEIDGALRWRIDSEACFTYWSKIGTDCARCVPELGAGAARSASGRRLPVRSPAATGRGGGLDGRERQILTTAGSSRPVRPHVPGPRSLSLCLRCHTCTARLPAPGPGGLRRILAIRPGSFSRAAVETASYSSFCIETRATDPSSTWVCAADRPHRTRIAPVPSTVLMRFAGAGEEDFQKATHRIYHDAARPSALRVGILRD
jgi:ferredoxin